MSFESFVGGRYLRVRQKQAFITLIAILSMAGITLGVMALIVVIAVMKGFDNELRKGILGGQSHVVVKSEDGAITGYQRLVKEVEKIDGQQFCVHLKQMLQQIFYQPLLLLHLIMKKLKSSLPKMFHL